MSILEDFKKNLAKSNNKAKLAYDKTLLDGYYNDLMNEINKKPSRFIFINDWKAEKLKSGNEVLKALTERINLFYQAEELLTNADLKRVLTKETLGLIYDKMKWELEYDFEKTKSKGGAELLKIENESKLEMFRSNIMDQLMANKDLSQMTDVQFIFYIKLLFPEDQTILDKFSDIRDSNSKKKEKAANAAKAEAEARLNNELADQENLNTEERRRAIFGNKKDYPK